MSRYEYENCKCNKCGEVHSVIAGYDRTNYVCSECETPKKLCAFFENRVCDEGCMAYEPSFFDISELSPDDPDYYGTCKRL